MYIIGPLEKCFVQECITEQNKIRFFNASVLQLGTCILSNRAHLGDHFSQRNRGSEINIHRVIRVCNNAFAKS